MLFAKHARAINRLLIVEDEPLVAFDNEHALNEAGFTIVATVDTVQAALDVIEHQEVDLVLADVSLSDGGDGLEVARAAHAKDLPVLFVTGNCPAEARSLAIGCLAKPYRPRDLLAALRAIERSLAGGKPGKLPPGLVLYLG